MKRRYKAGDWLRVPLGGDCEALAIIARACRSRLFGYFFAFPPDRTPRFDELRALKPADAVATMLFGGAPIEHGRWQVVATSLAFEEDAWPFPAFASRGAFGEAWTQVRYDSQTLQIVERTSIGAKEAQSLPDARFADAHEVETALRRTFTGDAAPRAESTCEIRSPLDAARLQAVAHGGCVQFSTPLSAADLAELAAFIGEHPHVRVRVHGFRRGFDANQLASLGTLRHLALDVHRLQHPQALAKLSAIRTLRIGAAQVDLAFLESLGDLQTLGLRGTRGPLAPVERCAALRVLHLENTLPVDFARMASAGVLHTLTLAHGDYDLENVWKLRGLRRLELRALDVTRLAAIDRVEPLEQLVLRDLHGVTDLSPIARAHSLRELEIAGMPQLNVPDFAPLAALELRDVRVDVGSRRKEREIYALLRFGNR